MEGSSNSSKRKGDGEQEGRKSGVKRQDVTMVMDVFDCAVCGKPLRPPIFQCSNKGNPICSPCHDKLPETDRATTQRLHFMERIVDNALVPCKHGCNRKIAYYRHDTHERECPVGPCVCPVAGCSFVAPTVVLLDHLTTLHKLPATPIDLFIPSYLPLKPGSQVLCSKHDRLFLLDMEPLKPKGIAVSIVCVQPAITRATVSVSVQFSLFDGHYHASKLEIKPDEVPRECLCIVPTDGETDEVLEVGIEICMVYYDNDELKEEEEKEEDDDQEWNHDDDDDD